MEMNQNAMAVSQAICAGDYIRKRRQKLELRAAQLEFFKKALFLVLAVWILTGIVYGLRPVRSTAMSPSLKDGDLALFYRLENDYLVGDIALYQDSYGQSEAARVVAVAGDIVEFDETNSLKVNGIYKTFDDERVVSDQLGTISYPYTVPEGSVFLLNDVLSNAEDSRSFGAVEVKDLDGKVIQLFRVRNF